MTRINQRIQNLFEAFHISGPAGPDDVQCFQIMSRDGADCEIIWPSSNPERFNALNDLWNMIRVPSDAEIQSDWELGVERCPICQEPMEYKQYDPTIGAQICENCTIGDALP